MTGATIQCLSHSANPAIEFGAADWIPTSIDLLTRQVPLYVGHSSKNPWSWRAASNCGRALTVRLLFPLSYTSEAGAAIRTPITDIRGPSSSPLSYTSTKLLCHNLEAVGRIALPLVCFAGRYLAVLATPPRTYLLTWSGRRDSNPRSRRWQRRVLATRRLPPSQNHGRSSES